MFKDVKTDQSQDQKSNSSLSDSEKELQILDQINKRLGIEKEETKQNQQKIQKIPVQDQHKIKKKSPSPRKIIPELFAKKNPLNLEKQSITSSQEKQDHLNQPPEGPPKGYIKNIIKSYQVNENQQRIKRSGSASPKFKFSQNNQNNNQNLERSGSLENINKNNRSPSPNTFQDLMKKANINKHDCQESLRQIENLINKGNSRMAGYMIQSVVKSSMKHFGKQSVKYIQEMRIIIKKSCELALRAINYQHNVTVCLDILTKCNELLSAGTYGYFPDCICLLWNNFGCAYRRMGQFNQSLQYFEKVIIYMKKYNVSSESGVTYLNLSSLLSQMGKHQESFQNGLQALNDCQTDVKAALNMALDKENQQLFREKVNYLAITNYNLGIECEFLKRYSDSIGYFKSACDVYEKYQLAEVFHKMYFKFKEQLMKAREKNLSGLETTAVRKPLTQVSAENSQDMQGLEPYQQAVNNLGPSYPTGAVMDAGEGQNYYKIQNILKKHTRNDDPKKRELFRFQDEYYDYDAQATQPIADSKQFQNFLDKKKTIYNKDNRPSKNENIKTFYYEAQQRSPINNNRKQSPQLKRPIIPRNSKSPNQNQRQMIQSNNNSYRQEQNKINQRGIKTEQENTLNNSSFEVDDDSSLDMLPQVNNFFFNKAKKKNEKDFDDDNISSDSMQKIEISKSHHKKFQTRKSPLKIKKNVEYQDSSESVLSYLSQQSKFQSSKQIESQQKLQKKQNKKIIKEKRRKFVDQNQQDKIFDTSFLSGEANESSLMPKDHRDVDLIGRLSWSSENIDSDDEVVFKNTRLNFLVDMNHYITKDHVKFDEAERLRKELEIKKETDEYKLQEKLKELEIQIQEVEEQKRRRQLLEQEEKDFKVTFQFMQALKVRNRQRRIKQMALDWVESYRIKKRARNHEKLNMLRQIQVARKIQKTYRWKKRKELEFEQTRQKAADFIIKFNASQTIKGFFRMLVRKSNEKQKYLFKVFVQKYLRYEEAALQIQKNVKMIYARYHYEQHKFAKKEIRKRLIHKRIVKLGPTKYSSAIEQEYYNLYFYEIIQSKSLEIILQSHNRNPKHFILLINRQEMLQFFEIPNNDTQDPRLRILTELFVENHKQYIIREEEDLLIDQFCLNKDKENLEVTILKNMQLMDNVINKQEDSDNDDQQQGDIEKKKRIQASLKRAKQNPMLNKHKIKKQIITIQRAIRNYLRYKFQETKSESGRIIIKKQSFKIFTGEYKQIQEEFKYSKTLKHQEISIKLTYMAYIEQGLYKEDSKTEQKLILADPPLTLGHKIEFYFKVKFINSKGLIGVGICLTSIAKFKQFELGDTKQIGHGYYGIQPDGTVFSNHDANKNKQKLSFTFSKGESIFCKVDEKQQIIIFRKQSTNEIFELEIVKNNFDTFQPCSLLYNEEDQIDIDGRFEYRQKVYDFVNLQLIDTNGKQEGEEFQVTLNNITKHLKYEPLSFPYDLMPYVIRDLSVNLQNYVYIDTEAQTVYLSDTAEEKLRIIRGENIKKQTLTNEQIYQQNINYINKIQAFVRAKQERDKMIFMRLKNENTQKKCAILVARTHIIVENQFDYLLLIYVDDVFTKLTIKAIKFEAHQTDRSKIEVFEIQQKLKSFLSILMLKFYATILAEKIELKRRNYKILVVAPNIEEIISEYSNKMGIDDDENTENMKTHISVKRKKQFKKNLRQQFTQNMLIPNSIQPEKEFLIIKNKEWQKKINKEVFKLENRKKPNLEINNNSSIYSPIKTQNDFEYAGESDEAENNFEECFEDETGRMMQDVKIFGQSIRKIQRKVRKYYMFKRIKQRKTNKGRGNDNEEDHHKREVEITNLSMKYISRYIAINKSIPFLYLECLINVQEKLFIFLTRDINKFRIQQRLQFEWKAAGLTEKFGTLESDYQFKYVKRFIQSHMQKDKKNKIEILYYKKDQDGGLSLSMVEDNYQKKLDTEDFSTDKFMVLLKIKKEISEEVNNLKMLFTWYYHCLSKQIIVIIIGSLKKWVKKTIVIDVEPYSTFLFEKIQNILGPNIQKQGGPTQNQVLKLKQIFNWDLNNIRQYLLLDQNLKTMSIKLDDQVFIQEKTNKAIRLLQSKIRSHIIKQKFNQMVMSKSRQLFFIKKLLIIKEYTIYQANAIYNRAEKILIIKGKKFSRAMFGEITQFQFRHSIVDPVRTQNIKSHKVYSVDQTTCESGTIFMIRRELNEYSDAVFEKLVYQENKLEDEKLYLQKIKQNELEIDSVVTLQKLWRSKKYLESLLWNQQQIRINRQIENELGEFIRKFITKINEKYWLITVRQKEGIYIFNGFNYVKRKHKIYGEFDPSGKHLKNIGQFEYIIDFLQERLSLDTEERHLIFNTDITSDQLLIGRSTSKKMHDYQKLHGNQLYKFEIYYHQMEKFEAKTLLDQDELDEQEKMPTVKINVDLRRFENIQKRAQQLESMEQALVETSEKISKGIKLNKQGSIILDQDNVDPKGIQINESKLDKVLKRSELVQNKQINRFNELDKYQVKKFTKVLAKGLKIDSVRKYLVQIKLIEVPMKVIDNISTDAVFSQCERVFAIDSRTLDNSYSISWKMSLRDYEILTQTKNWTEGAKYLLKIIHMAQKRMVIQLEDDIDQIIFNNRPDDFLMITKRQLIMIQQQLRRQRFRQNFKKHRNYISSLKGTIIGKKLGTIEDQEYIICIALIVDEDGNKQYLIMSWDLKNFHKLETSLSWKEDIEFYIPDKILTANICDNLFIYQETQEINLILNVSFLDTLLNEYKIKYEERLKLIDKLRMQGVEVDSDADMEEIIEKQNSINM